MQIIFRFSATAAAMMATACVVTAAGALAAHADTNDAVAPDYTCTAVEGPNNDICTFTTSSWVAMVEDSGGQFGRRVMSVSAVSGHTFATGKSWATLTFVDLGRPFVSRPPIPSGDAHEPVQPAQPMPTLSPAGEPGRGGAPAKHEGSAAETRPEAQGGVVTVMVTDVHAPTGSARPETPGAGQPGATTVAPSSAGPTSMSTAPTSAGATPRPTVSDTPVARGAHRQDAPLGGRSRHEANVAAEQTVEPDGTRRPVTVSALGVGVSTALLTLAGPTTIAVASSRRRTH